MVFAKVVFFFESLADGKVTVLESSSCVWRWHELSVAAMSD